MKVKCLFLLSLFVSANVGLAQQTLPSGSGGFELSEMPSPGMQNPEMLSDLIDLTSQTLPGHDDLSGSGVTGLPSSVYQTPITNVSLPSATYRSVEVEELQRWSGSLEFCLLELSTSEFKSAIESDIHRINKLPLIKQVEEKSKALKALVKHLSEGGAE